MNTKVNTFFHGPGVLSHTVLSLGDFIGWTILESFPAIFQGGEVEDVEAFHDCCSQVPGKPHLLFVGHAVKLASHTHENSLRSVSAIITLCR